MLGVFSQASIAQSVDDILADAEAQSEQISRVLTRLKEGDEASQYSLVEALLKSEDKALLRIGREYALFSKSPVLQNMAIESVFNRKLQVRMEMTQPDKPDALKWLEGYGGGQDGRTGFVMMPVGKFDAEQACYEAPDARKRCRFTIVGSSVQFRMFTNGGRAKYRGSAALTLQPDGTLSGPFSSGFGDAVLSIDLKE